MSNYPFETLHQLTQRAMQLSQIPAQRRRVIPAEAIESYIRTMRQASRQRFVSIDYGKSCAHVADDLQIIVDNESIEI